MDRPLIAKAARKISRRAALLLPAVLALPLAASAQTQTPPAAPLPAELVGRWLAEDIGGGGVIDRLQSTLEIRENGTAGGNTGCNVYGGTIRVDGTGLEVSQIAATMRACSGAIGDQERKFLAALSAARRFEINTVEQKLFLQDADGKLTMRLARM